MKQESTVDFVTRTLINVPQAGKGILSLSFPARICKICLAQTSFVPLIWEFQPVALFASGIGTSIYYGFLLALRFQFT